MAAAGPAPKIVPLQINRRPVAKGIGADSLNALARRCTEIGQAIGIWRSELPELAAAVTPVVPALQIMISLQATALAQFQVEQRRVQAEQGPMALAAADHQVPRQGFASVQARQDAVGGAATVLLNGGNARALDAVVAGLADTASRAAARAVTTLAAARAELDRAELKATLPDFDEELDRRARIWERTVFGWPLVDRMQRVLKLYQNPALDDAEARALEAGLRPHATELTAAGVVTAKRHAINGALPTGAASAEDVAAKKFLNASAARIAARTSTDALARARETLKQAEIIFLKTAGRDASDPASVATVDYNGSPTKGFNTAPTPDVDVKGGPRWLARYARATAPIALLPWTTFGPDDVKIIARKAAAR